MKFPLNDPKSPIWNPISIQFDSISTAFWSFLTKIGQKFDIPSIFSPIPSYFNLKSKCRLGSTQFHQISTKSHEIPVKISTQFYQIPTNSMNRNVHGISTKFLSYFTKFQPNSIKLESKSHFNHFPNKFQSSVHQISIQSQNVNHSQSNFNPTWANSNQLSNKSQNIHQISTKFRPNFDQISTQS